MMYSVDPRVRRCAYVVALIAVVLVAESCTSASSAPTRAVPTIGGSFAPPVMASPQPETCPKQWNRDPVSGSDITMVPGEPVIAVSCGTHSVIQGSQLTTLVSLLNSLPTLPPGFVCDPLVKQGPVISTQLYFNYPSGQVQLVNMNPQCDSVSNGILTAKFTQALTGSVDSDFRTGTT